MMIRKMAPHWEVEDAVGELIARPPRPTPPCLGKHILGEFFDCAELPNDPEQLRGQMETVARLIGATIVQSVFHEFNPHGLSGVVVIAESHLAIHTWPEYRCASVDLFSCSADLDPLPGLTYLRSAFQAGATNVIEVPRGGRAAMCDSRTVSQPYAEHSVLNLKEIIFPERNG